MSERHRCTNGTSVFGAPSDCMYCLQAELARLREIVERWPRVYFESMDPRTLTDGCRVLSVQGKEGEDWFDVTIDSDGEEICAPTDFGLYSTEAAAREGKEKDDGMAK